MIEILFPPGCYGTYLGRCLYNYTDIRVGDYSEFTFDEHGSSHVHRYATAALSVIKVGHLAIDNCTTILSLTDPEKIITILPVPDHRLDYYVNQYYKEENGNFIKYILKQLSIDEINNKLTVGWAYPSIDDAPPWAIREFLSYYIMDCLTRGYAAEPYAAVPSKLCITAQDIILHIEDTLDKICQAI